MLVDEGAAVNLMAHDTLRKLCKVDQDCVCVLSMDGG
jgi:hypothetical protein